MPISNTLGPIRYYTKDDPYYYTVDNRPLQDLSANTLILANTLDSILSGGTPFSNMSTTIVSTSVVGGPIRFLTTGGEQLRVINANFAVNFVEIVGSVTSGQVVIGNNGADANPPLVIATKGTGRIAFVTDRFGTSSEQFRVNHTASAINYVSVAGSASGGAVIIGAGGTDATINIVHRSVGNTSSHTFDAAGIVSFKAEHVSSGVNFCHVKASPTGSPVILMANGTDNNVGLTIASKGTSSIVFYTNTVTLIQFAINHTAAAVNYLNVAGAITGSNPILSPAGTDGTIGMNFATKGAAPIQFTVNSVTCWQINSTGHLVSIDGVYDIGTVGASRPRSGYFANGLSVGPLAPGAVSGVLFLDRPNFPAMVFSTAGVADTQLRVMVAGTLSVTDSVGSVERWRFANGSLIGSSDINTQVNLRLTQTGIADFTIANEATTGNVTISGAAAMELKNSTVGQIFRVYNTFTDASNYERLGVYWSGNIAIIEPQNAGTGTARALKFRVSNVDAWTISTAAFLLAGVDNSYDIGASAATRPRSLYLGSRCVAGDITVTYSASMTIDSSTGNNFTITANNGTAFTINAPTNPVTGQRITITLRNTAGGALGAATWNAVFKMVAWINPGSATSRSIEFKYDGTNWVERMRSAADVPN